MIPLSKVFDNLDLTKIAQPTFSTIPGVEVKPTRIVNFSDIYIEDDFNNLAREHGISPTHVANLKMSFGTGVDLTQYPPAIRKRNGNGLDKPWELVYGFGRTLSLIELKQLKWYFTEIVVDENTMDDVRANENEDLPRLSNKEQDLKMVLVNKINKGILKNNESAIRTKLNQIAPYRAKQSKDKIVAMVMGDSNTPQKYSFYSPGKAHLWIENHSTVEYQIGGELDTKVNQFGYLVKEGYQYRFVVNAIKNYAETGKKSYCLAHMGSPTERSTIPQKRKKFKEELNSLLDSLKKCGMTSNICKVMGYLPQEVGIDNWKVLR
tara:strand:+ start:967 stop:1929 length:963 start_codon:yes stop_codon:yes gene_type:complete